VTTIELGVQSLQDPVLEMSRRGYKATQVVTAVKHLKNFGFQVGIQLMLGLPGDSEKGFLDTIEMVIDLKPAMVRLYPTLVIQGTPLAEWYIQKRYKALELEEAIKLCVEAVKRLETNRIAVIRIGLMSSPTLLQPGQILAGPWHACFGFLVRSALYHQMIEPKLPKPGLYPVLNLRVALNEIPLIRGYKNQGLRLIEKKTGSKIAAVIGDKSLAKGCIEVVAL
jgi:histone acetyltransferase (RNA polymerase elongator complex component)